MARRRRLNEAGALHHITARGVDGCPIFLDDHDRRQFMSLLAESRARFGCRVVAFCLMTNHVHLVIRDDRGTLSRTQHLLNGVYAKRFNLRHGRTGHLLERRFWSSRLGSDSYLTTCAAYVHRNPVEAGLVASPEDYRWSSYPAYVGLRSTPAFLDTGLLVAHHGDVADLQRFTEQPLGDGPLAQQLDMRNRPAVLTTAPTDPAQLTSTPAVASLDITFDDVVEACSRVAGIDVDCIMGSTRGRRNDVRNLAIYVGYRHAGLDLRQMADALGVGLAAVSAAHRRFDELLDHDRRALLDEVLQQLGLSVSC
jgi:REP element-mobilizing transposase RayT